MMKDFSSLEWENQLDILKAKEAAATHAVTTLWALKKEGAREFCSKTSQNGKAVMAGTRRNRRV